MKQVVYFLLLVFSFLGISCTKVKRNHVKSSNIPHVITSSPHIKDATSSVSRSNPLNSQNRMLEPSEIFNRYNRAVFMIYTTDGVGVFQGSGFFISSDGLAVSNYHVFKGTSVGCEVIKLADGRQFKILEVIKKSELNDYILFRIKGKFDYIPITQRKSKVGEKVYTIGSPRGLENTFSSGEISQIRQNNYIQISCPIDHGSSGGALINTYGEVIGITTGGHNESGANLNFAKNIHVISEIDY